MPQSMQEMLNKSLMELPSQQYTPSNTAASEFAPLSALSAMGAGPYADPAGIRAQKAQELAQYGTDPQALQQMIAPANEPTYGQQMSIMPEAQRQIASPEPIQPIEVSTEVQPQALPTEPTKQIEKLGMKAATQGYQEGAYQAGMQKGMFDEIQSLTKQYQDRQKANQEALDKALLDSQKLQEEAFKIQPQDFWANKSTGAKIAAGLAMAVGAYSSAMTGGPNTAKQIIDGAIAQDLALQKEKYQRAKDRGATAQTYYATLVNKLGNQEAADITMLNNAYKMVDTKLKAQEANATNQERLMNIQKIRSEIYKNLMETQQKQTEILARENLMKGVQTGKEQIYPKGSLDPKQEELYIRDPEFHGFAPTKEEAIDFRKTLPGYRTTIRDLARLDEIASIPGKSLSPTLEAEVMGISQRLVAGALKDEVLGPGTITPSERELVLNDVLGKPTQIMSLDKSTKTKLKSLVNFMQYRKGEQAKILGLSGRMKPSFGNKVTIQYQGLKGPITKDVTPEEADLYEKNAKAKNIPFKRLGE